MRRHLYIFLFIVLSLTGKTQNLISNNSFEQYNVLYCNGAGFDLPNWSYLSTPDYYTINCPLVGGGGVPSNMFGYALPKSGSAYAGIGTLGLPFERKEYIYQQLASPLISGKSYYVSFFISKADRTRIATEKIGAYFSSSVPVAPANTFVNATPQVENHSGFLTDTVNWVKIEGYFTALGGEEYITIGNFNSNANTDTLYTGTSNPFTSDAGTAYYYIDSVSLYDSLTYVTNIKELKNEIDFSISPNPTNNICTISSKTIIQKTELTNIAGQVLLSEIINEKTHQLQLQNYAEGIYFVRVVYPNGLSTVKKVVKQ